MPAGAGEFPPGFVYLRHIAPAIEQEIRYAGPHNFTGDELPGYAAAECVLVRPAAESLKQVQAELAPQGLGLKVFDCYRPVRAVSAFVRWAKQPDAPGARDVWYPELEKERLFPDYIALRSGHSRGATVDVTLISLDGSHAARKNPDRPLRTGETKCTDSAQAAAFGELDMGTMFDCFDAESNTAALGLSPRQRANRETLVRAMAKHGFENYPMEWWHFTFRPEPYPDTYFDFPIIAPSPESAPDRD